LAVNQLFEVERGRGACGVAWLATSVNTSTGVQEVVAGEWRLGRVLCDFWTTSDVFCCTASILNIAAIALDRYWLITRNVAYTHAHRLPRRRACRLMATAAWTTAAVISVAPLLGWRTGYLATSLRNVM